MLEIAVITHYEYIWWASNASEAVLGFYFREFEA